MTKARTKSPAKKNGIVVLVTAWNLLSAVGPWLLIIWGLWKAFDAGMSRYVAVSQSLREKWSEKIEEDHGHAVTDVYWREHEIVLRRHSAQAMIRSAGLLAAGAAWLWWH